jgi:hypothetical protein
MNDPYAELVRDAFDVLDRHRAPIGRRDPVKSLEEDRGELLGRMRAALQPLVVRDPDSSADVVAIVRRIDEMCAAASAPRA